MRYLVLASVAFGHIAAALLLSAAMPADALAQKAKSNAGPSCNRQSCTETCVKRGGRPQYCSTWCDQQIAANSKCK